jgi:hypothetical protein
MCVMQYTDNPLRTGFVINLQNPEYDVNTVIEKCCYAALIALWPGMSTHRSQQHV